MWFKCPASLNLFKIISLQTNFLQTFTNAKTPMLKLQDGFSIDTGCHCCKLCINSLKHKLWSSGWGITAQVDSWDSNPRPDETGF